MTLTIIPLSAHRHMPWKNGQGETAEIAAEPHEGGFLWRLSIAHIERSGAFSAYLGIERWITVLDGDGMRLLVSGTEPRIMRMLDPPARFPGEADTQCELLGSAIHDINLMLDRRHADGRMEILSRPGEYRLEDETVLLYAATPGIAVSSGGNGPVELATGETAALHAGGGAAMLAAGATAIVARIARRPVADRRS